MTAIFHGQAGYCPTWRRRLSTEHMGGMHNNKTLDGINTLFYVITKKYDRGQFYSTSILKKQVYNAMYRDGQNIE